MSAALVRTSNPLLLALPLNRFVRTSAETLDAVMLNADELLLEVANLTMHADLYRVDGILVAVLSDRTDRAIALTAVDSIDAFWDLREVAHIDETTENTCLCYASWCTTCAHIW